MLLHAPAWSSATSERLEEITRAFMEAGPAISWRIAMTEGDDGAIIATLSDASSPTPFVVDDIAVTWRPAGGRLYDASLTLPAVSVLDDEGNTLARITADGTLDLSVHIDTGHLASADMNAWGVTVSPAGGVATLHIDHLTASLKLTETAPSTWTGEADIAIEGLAVTGGDATTVSLVRGHAATWFRDVPATAPEEGLTQGASLGGTVSLEHFSGMGAGMESSLLEFTVAGDDGNRGTIGITYSHEGFALEDAGLAPVAPRSMAGDVTLDVVDLPAVLTRPGMPQGATLGLDLDWTWPDGAGNVSGRLASAPLAPVTATGTLRLVTRGMEDLVENVKAAARDGHRQARHLVTYLALFRAMGRHDETVDGPRLIHDIVLAPDNRILVNDNDINILFSLLNPE